MYRSKMLAAVAVIAVGVLACDDQPLEPEEELNVDLVAVDDYDFMYGRGPGQGCESGPHLCFGTTATNNRSYLGALVRDAYEKLLTTEGQAAADAAFATLWALHQQAFALRSTDHNAFVAAMQAAHIESARLVVQILGAATAQAAIQLANSKLAELQAMITQQAAAGVTTDRLEYLADRIEAFIAEANSKLAAGDAAAALDLASRAIQAATMGGGQNARSGNGNGGGQRNRGGK